MEHDQQNQTIYIYLNILYKETHFRLVCAVAKQSIK